jgi:hypothetical protein
MYVCFGMFCYVMLCMYVWYIYNIGHGSLYVQAREHQSTDQRSNQQIRASRCPHAIRYVRSTGWVCGFCSKHVLDTQVGIRKNFGCMRLSPQIGLDKPTKKPHLFGRPGWMIPKLPGSIWGNFTDCLVSKYGGYRLFLCPHCYRVSCLGVSELHCTVHVRFATDEVDQAK